MTSSEKASMLLLAAMMTPMSAQWLLWRVFQEGHHHPSDPLFRRVIRAPRSGDYLSGKMSYTRARELIREGLQRAGIHPDGLGTHSLRSGGATAAANAGVADRLIQRHGGWRCATSQHCYIEENLSDLMSVSQHIMGIH